jgi:hypothetical protein
VGHAAGAGAPGPGAASGRAPASLALLVYLGAFWTVILLPFDFRLPALPGREPAPAPAADEIEPRDLIALAIQSLGHAALFLPLGPLLLWWTGMPPRRLLHPLAAGAAVLLAGISELSQLTVGRGASWSDFLLDLAGYAAGAWAACSFERRGTAWTLARAAASPRIALPALGALAAGALFLLLPASGLPFGPRDLERWDPSYPFLAGNELTRRRPWSGALERFRVHDRALEPADLEGPHARAPIIDYRFAAEDLALGPDGRVAEVRSRAGPTLRATKGSEILPLPGGGIELRGGRSLLSGEDPAAIEALRRAGEVSIHARFRTGDLRQSGPARIVSCSISNTRRNFTLGQDLDDLEIRVRTPLTGRNGSRQALRVAGCLDSDRWVDVVATYGSGDLTLYVDGALRGRVHLSLIGWAVAVAFGAELTAPVACGLAFLAWAAGFAILWIVLERLGGSRPRSIRRAALGAALLVLVLLAAAAA